MRVVLAFFSACVALFIAWKSMNNNNTAETPTNKVHSCFWVMISRSQSHSERQRVVLPQQEAHATFRTVQLTPTYYVLFNIIPGYTAQKSMVLGITRLFHRKIFI